MPDPAADERQRGFDQPIARTPTIGGCRSRNQTPRRSGSTPDQRGTSVPRTVDNVVAKTSASSASWRVAASAQAPRHRRPSHIALQRLQAAHDPEDAGVRRRVVERPGARPGIGDRRRHQDRTQRKGHQPAKEPGRREIAAFEQVVDGAGGRVQDQRLLKRCGRCVAQPELAGQAGNHVAFQQSGRARRSANGPERRPRQVAPLPPSCWAAATPRTATIVKRGGPNHSVRSWRAAPVTLVTRSCCDGGKPSMDCP